MVPQELHGRFAGVFAQRLWTTRSPERHFAEGAGHFDPALLCFTCSSVLLGEWAIVGDEGNLSAGSRPRRAS